MTRSARRNRLFAPAMAVLGTTALGTTLIAAAPVSARLYQDATEYTLQRLFKKGDVDRYKMSLTAKVNNDQTGNQEVEIVFAMRMKETTKEVKADGSGVLLREFEQAYAKIGDAFEQDLTASLPKVTQTVDSSGRVLSSKTEGGAGDFGAGGGSQMFSLAQTAFYPPKPVKIGDTWKIEQGDPKAKEAEKRARFEGEGRVVGKETIKGIETLKIKSIATVTPDKEAEKLNLDGTSNLDPKTGKIVKVEGTIEGTFGPLGKTKARLSLDMITDADKPTDKPADKKDR